METLHVELGERRYPSISAPACWPARTAAPPHPRPQVLVVSNTTVATAVPRAHRAMLTGLRCEAAILPDGERYKTLDTLDRVFTALLDHRFDRHCNPDRPRRGGDRRPGRVRGGLLSARRPFHPDSHHLLAQVDSSVGGKTAVNHPLGKN